MAFFFADLTAKCFAQDVPWVTPNYINNHHTNQSDINYITIPSVVFPLEKPLRQKFYYTQVFQGSAGSCLFLARLAAIASTRFSWLKSLVSEENMPQRYVPHFSNAPSSVNGKIPKLYHLKIPYFKDPAKLQTENSYQEKKITLTNQFYFTKMSSSIYHPLYSHVWYVNDPIYITHNQIWPALFEKALAGLHGTYENISHHSLYGFGSGILTGGHDEFKTVSKLLTNNQLFERLHEHVVVNRLPAVLSSNIENVQHSFTVDPLHAYAVINVNLEKKEIYAYDPHGEHIYMDENFLKNNMHIVSFMNFSNDHFSDQDFPPVQLDSYPNHLHKIEEGYSTDNVDQSCVITNAPDDGFYNRKRIEVDLLPKYTRAIAYLDEQVVEENNRIWPFSWSEVKSGLRRRLISPSSLEQAGLATCGPTFITSVFIDHNPKYLVDVTVHLFKTGNVLYYDGTSRPTTENFRNVNWVSLNDSEDEIDNLEPFEYMFQGAITNSRSGISGITAGWVGRPGPGLRSATTARRASKYLKDIVGLKKVKLVKTPMRGVLGVSAEVSQIIENEGDKVYVGMLMLERDQSFDRQNPRLIRWLPNHFIRMRSPIDFGSGQKTYYDTSIGPYLTEDSVTTAPNTVTFSYSTHYSRSVKNISYAEFIDTTYAYIIATDDEELFERYPFTQFWKDIK